MSAVDVPATASGRMWSCSQDPVPGTSSSNSETSCALVLAGRGDTSKDEDPSPVGGELGPVATVEQLLIFSR